MQGTVLMVSAANGAERCAAAIAGSRRAALAPKLWHLVELAGAIREQLRPGV
jgi:hypothetical protein